MQQHPGVIIMLSRTSHTTLGLWEKTNNSDGVEPGKTVFILQWRTQSEWNRHFLFYDRHLHTAGQGNPSTNRDREESQILNSYKNMKKHP